MNHMICIQARTVNSELRKLEMALQSWVGMPDTLVVDHHPSITSNLFRRFHATHRLPAVFWWVRVLWDTVRAFAKERKDDWDVWLPYASFAVDSDQQLGANTGR